MASPTSSSRSCTTARGYRARVTGAEVLSKPNRQHLILRANAGAKRVALTVVPR